MNMFNLAIAEFPDDNLTFLAYADFLEENRDTEKSEFFRELGNLYKKGNRFKHRKNYPWRIIISNKQVWIIEKNIISTRQYWFDKSFDNIGYYTDYIKKWNVGKDFLERVTNEGTWIIY